MFERLRHLFYNSSGRVIGWMWSGFNVHFTVQPFGAVFFYKSQLPPFRKQLQKQNACLAAPIFESFIVRGQWFHMGSKSSSPVIPELPVCLDWTFFALKRGGMYSFLATLCCKFYRGMPYFLLCKKCINTCLPLSTGELFKCHISVATY